MAEFSFYQPVRMEFGAGKLESAGKITSSFGDSCLLVTTTNSEDVLRPLYDRVKGILEKAGVRYIHFDEVVPNPDIRGIEKAIDIVRREKLQVILAVGGGSSSSLTSSIRSSSTSSLERGEANRYLPSVFGKNNLSLSIK